MHDNCYFKKLDFPIQTFVFSNVYEPIHIQSMFYNSSFQYIIDSHIKTCWFLWLFAINFVANKTFAYR